MRLWQFRSTAMRSVILAKVSVPKIAWVHVLAASIGEGWGGAFLRRVFWWRHCSTAPPTVTWPKPRPRSSGWRPRQPTTGWLSVKSGCCDYKLYRRGLTATPRLTRTSGTATATWRETLEFDGHMAWAEAMP